MGRPKMRRNPIHLTLEWLRMLDSGTAKSKADLARMLDVSRAHVSQVLGVLTLAPRAPPKLFAYLALSERR